MKSATTPAKLLTSSLLKLGFGYARHFVGYKGCLCETVELPVSRYDSLPAVAHRCLARPDPSVALRHLPYRSRGRGGLEKMYHR